MSGNGPLIGGRPSINPMRRSRAAFRKIRAAGQRKEATTPASLQPSFPARSSKADHICARRITAAATVQRPAMRKTWTHPQPIWDSDASFEGEAEGPFNSAIGDLGDESLTKMLARFVGGRCRSFDGERPRIRTTATEAQYPLHHG